MEKNIYDERNGLWRMLLLTEQLAERGGVTEQLKAGAVPAVFVTA